jgi:hypothetical protein
LINHNILKLLEDKFENYLINPFPISDEKEKNLIIIELIRISDNISKSKKKYSKIICESKIPKFLKQIYLTGKNSNNHNKEIVIFFKNLIKTSRKKTFPNIMKLDLFEIFESEIYSFRFKSIKSSIIHVLDTIYSILKRIKWIVLSNDKDISKICLNLIEKYFKIKFNN